MNKPAEEAGFLLLRQGSNYFFITLKINSIHSIV